MSIPVRFQVEVTLSGKDRPKQELAFEIDYFLFEPYLDTSKEFAAMATVGCIGRKSPVNATFPGKPNDDDESNSMRRQFAVTLETRTNQETVVRRHEVRLEQNEMI